jgi:hypothetical protein
MLYIFRCHQADLTFDDREPREPNGDVSHEWYTRRRSVAVRESSVREIGGLVCPIGRDVIVPVSLTLGGRKMVTIKPSARLTLIGHVVSDVR